MRTSQNVEANLPVDPNAKPLSPQERMQRLADNVVILVWMTDAQDTCVFMNDSTLYAPQQWAEFSGAAWGRNMHPDDSAAVTLLIAQARAAQREYQVEYRICKSDGTLRWMLSCGAPRRAADGTFLGYNGTMVDVSARHEALEQVRRSEAEFRQREERFRSLTKLSSDWYWETDAEARFTFLSDGLYRLFGTFPEEVLGRTRSDRAADPDQPGLLAYLERVAARESFRDLPYSAYVPSRGVVRHAVISGEPVFDNDVFTGYRGTGRDVTEQIEVAARLALLAEENNAIVENALELMVILDSEGRYLRVNEAARAILGYEPAEMLGRHYTEFLLPDDQGKRSAAERQMRQGATSIADLETRWCHKDGRIVHLASSVRWSESAQIMYATGRDVTKRRTAEEATRISDRRLRSIIEMTPAGYIMTDAHGFIVGINPAFSSMTGYLSAELMGMDVMRLLVHCPVDNALFRQGGITSAHGKEATLVCKDGQQRYVLINVTIERDDAGNAQTLTAFITDITERKHGEARMEQLATHDALTGLPNRSLINSRMQQMLSAATQGQQISLMFIDLDRFKEVNDSLGHVNGDALLQDVAKRFKHVTRPQDMIARLGGDEFVAASHCTNGVQSATVIAERLLAALVLPFTVDGHEVFVSASIGISMYPEDGMSNATLFQNADIAMYRAKAAGRNGYCFFKAHMSAETRTRMTLENALHRALERNEFELHYQPRIDLCTMQATGMEALIRWNHPQLGRVAPLDFIPLAEERGFIEAIGKWVLQEACLQCRRLSCTYGIPLQVSVNVAARQLKSADFTAHVVQALESAELAPRFLELELTESALIDNIDATATVLHALREMGVRISVDDFGTGFSGLTYLRRFPLDILKLDRSFLSHETAGVRSDAFIKAFVDMAHTLDLSVVAEGVEDDATCEFLRDCACDEAQGYLFARPLPLAAFEAYIAAQVNAVWVAPAAVQ
ncbi:MAG: EAL domain-containing protein [Herminiimonas sp.]|nr:EAL domain-containing protein [Herminiimonas sp.]